MTGPSGEAAYLAQLRRFAGDPAARALLDDAAVLMPPSGRALVLTHDAIAEGVHYLADDPPADVAWKLVAVNLSDLAAKGAVPLGVLTGHCLGDPAWDAAFAAGLGAALDRWAVPLLGGDTIALPPGSPRVLGLTAIGHADPAAIPDRRGAQAGDLLWVTGTIGDAGLGLRLLQAGGEGDPALVARYRRPTPRLAAGQALAPYAHASADVSDGLLIDGARIAAASGLSVTIDLARLPLSPAARRLGDSDRSARLAAATAGDDYELLIAATATATPAIAEIAARLDLAITAIGQFGEGSGLVLRDGAELLPLPPSLGHQHATPG